MSPRYPPGPRAIRRLADDLAAADADLDAHPHDPEYVQRWRMALARLYSQGWQNNMAALQAGEAHAIEPAIDFLDADPMCFRSGYTKEKICQYLARMDLSKADRARLVPIVNRALADEHRPGRERKHWLRLADALGLAAPPAS